MDEHLQALDLTRTLAGDGQAYARIVVAHQAAIARRMRWFARQPAVLEELVQEVFVEAYYSLPRYRGEGPLEAWLARIATRVGYRHWKRLKRRTEAARDPEWWRGVGQPVAESTNPDAAAQLVQRLLDQLPPRDRLILLLVYVQGNSLEEAARLAGWSHTMAKVQAFRARKKLKTLLEQRGVTSLQAALDLAAEPDNEATATKPRSGQTTP